MTKWDASSSILLRDYLLWHVAKWYIWVFLMFRVDFFKWPISVISLGPTFIIKSPKLQWPKGREVMASPQPSSIFVSQSCLADPFWVWFIVPFSSGSTELNESAILVRWSFATSNIMEVLWVSYPNSAKNLAEYLQRGFHHTTKNQVSQRGREKESHCVNIF